jgi:hypothetical protein
VGPGLSNHQTPKSKNTFTIRSKNTPESYYEESKNRPEQKGDQMDIPLVIFVITMAIAITVINVWFHKH